MIYLDHSATTPLDKEIFDKISPYFCETFGNANSIHAFGRSAATAVADARERVAAAINSKPNEIYFTSGGTESDNWAVLGFLQNAKGAHLMVSAIEHPAVMAAADEWGRRGGCVSKIPVSPDGIIDLDAAQKMIQPDTALISVMLANNEIGTIQPIAELAAIAHSKGIKIHTDAVQAVGNIPVDVRALGVDMLSLSAHKFYGPKGAGALFIRNGVKPAKLIIGGHQERTMRGGTTNVAAVAGLGFAIEQAVRDLDKNAAYIHMLRDRFCQRVTDEIEFARYNGHRELRIPGNANFCFEFIEGEALLLRLDLEGIAVSSGSACSSGSLEPSHVLLALGLPHEMAHGSIRFSFGKNNTVDEVDAVVAALKKIVGQLRELSPLIATINTPKYKA